MGRIVLQRRQQTRGHRRAGRRKAVVRQGVHNNQGALQQVPRWAAATASTNVGAGASRVGCGVEGRGKGKVRRANTCIWR